MTKHFLTGIFALSLSMLMFASTDENTEPAPPTGAIEGLFSIADGKQVYFSQGNLIKNEDGTWSFANQLSGVPDGKGLFAWGTSGYTINTLGNENRTNT